MLLSDIVTILSILVAVASVISEPQLEAVFPGKGAYLAGVLAILGVAAAQIIRVLTNKAGALPQAIAVGTPSVPAGTTVLTNETPIVGVNVTQAHPDPAAPPQTGTTK